MKRILFLMIVNCFTSVVCAQKPAKVMIDIYGTNPMIGKKILQEYRKELQHYVDLKEQSDGGFKQNPLHAGKSFRVIY